MASGTRKFGDDPDFDIPPKPKPVPPADKTRRPDAVLNGMGYPEIPGD